RMVRTKSRALVASALHAPDPDHNRVRQDRVSLEHRSVPVDTIRGVTMEHRRSGARPPQANRPCGNCWAIAQHQASLDITYPPYESRPWQGWLAEGVVASR